MYIDIHHSIYVYSFRYLRLLCHYALHLLIWWSCHCTWLQYVTLMFIVPQLQSVGHLLSPNHWWKHSCTSYWILHLTTYISFTSWGFQPVWNILVKLASSSPNRGENKKSLTPTTLGLYIQAGWPGFFTRSPNLSVVGIPLRLCQWGWSPATGWWTFVDKMWWGNQEVNNFILHSPAPLC